MTHPTSLLRVSNGKSGRIMGFGLRTENTISGQVTTSLSDTDFPETIESYFYAYRLTGNKLWQERAWEAFQHISQVTHAPYGNSGINDVMAQDGGSKRDEQESFWFAETLKYLYLIFDDPERLSLDDWVFTTEAHPLKRRREVEWES